MLHIINGGSTEQTLKQTTVPGELFCFRDALIEGPAPAGADAETWRRIRAEHLAGDYGVGLQECLDGLDEQEQVLRSFPDHEEVILWFEHDLFCQLNLIYLLNWFSSVELGQTRLSLINIGEFPGRENFYGLGELDANELASLLPQRREVTGAELKTAANAWHAFSSPDPKAIEHYLATNSSAWPFLKTALTAHLERFPSVANGLGRIENRCLQLVDSGAERFTDLFSKFWQSESVYGVGDAQVWTTLSQLRDARTPLITSNTTAKHLSPELVSETTFTITDAGRAVLHNEADFLSYDDIDVWLGGAHLESGKQIWRWDPNTNQLIN
ncbi:MAG: hypothetical protein C5B55_14145 [Blastocatellia bacterium]|nr:MAG: hypothetical protein C5B55_14145 [Blastocatellia bacterium]